MTFQKSFMRPPLNSFFARFSPGSYILCQSCDRYDLLYLYYYPSRDSVAESSSSRQSRPELLYIVVHEPEDGQVGSHRYRLSGGPAGIRATEFASIRDLVRTLRLPSSESSGPILGDCVHPSENDKSPTLLLCRSIAKMKAGAWVKNIVSLC